MEEIQSVLPETFDFRDCQSFITLVPIRKAVFKRVSLFLPAFQRGYSDKAGLCWQGEKVRVKMHVGGIIEWTV